MSDCPATHTLGFRCALKAGHKGKHVPVRPRHPCHAKGCNVEVPPRMLMCLPHWRMVPRVLQKAIWATYVPGQEIRKDPTPEYIEAHLAAIEAVARKEGR